MDLDESRITSRDRFHAYRKCQQRVWSVAWKTIYQGCLLEHLHSVGWKIKLDNKPAFWNIYLDINSLLHGRSYKVLVLGIYCKCSSLLGYTRTYIWFFTVYSVPRKIICSSLLESIFKHLLFILFHGKSYRKMFQPLGIYIWTLQYILFHGNLNRKILQPFVMYSIWTFTVHWFPWKITEKMFKPF